MKKLERVREVKNEDRAIREDTLQNLSDDFQYTHLLSQLQRNRNQNDLDNSYALKQMKNSSSRNTVYDSSKNNDLAVRCEKNLFIESNQTKVMNSKIDRELGIMAQMNFMKKKNHQKHRRVVSDLNFQGTKFSNLKTVISDKIQDHNNTQSNLFDLNSKHNSVKEIYKKQVKQGNKSVYDVEK